MFLTVPAGYLGLLPGFAVFIAFQAALVAMTGRLLVPGRLAGALALVASPAFVENALGGQNGGITGPLLVAGLWLAPRRPWLAGVLFGLLTIKPQLGLLVPVALLASRNWRAIAAAAATAVLLVLASGLAFGWEAWAAFWRIWQGQMSRALETPWHGLLFQRMMVTPFALLRGLGAGLSLASAVQTAVLAVCAGGVVWVWRARGVDHRLRVALTLVLALLATPYGYTYDMLGVAAAVVLAVQAGVTWVKGPWVRQVLIVAWMWPGVAVAITLIDENGTWPPPLGAVVLAGLAAVLVREARMSMRAVA